MFNTAHLKLRSRQDSPHLKTFQRSVFCKSRNERIVLQVMKTSYATFTCMGQWKRSHNPVDPTAP